MKLSKLGIGLKREVHRVTHLLSWVASGVIFLMMLLTFGDFFGRYALKRPITGSQDVTEMMMVIVVFFGFAYTANAKGHVNVDLLTSRFSRHTQAILGMLTSSASLVIFALISWQLYLQAWDHLLNPNIVSQTIGVPVGPFRLVAAIGASWLWLEFLVDFFDYVGEAMGK